MLLVLPLLAALAAEAKDDLVQDFRRVFAKIREPVARVEAVLALDPSESPEVVGALLGLCAGQDDELRRAAITILSSFAEEPPRAELFAALARTKDERTRLALLSAVCEGRYTGGEDVLLRLLSERAWAVRAEAARALGAGGAQGASAALAILAADKEPVVRAAALDALALLGAEEVIEPARAALLDASWQVRAAAANALGRVRRLESIPLLIARLEAEPGRLREDLARALERLTGRALGPRPEAWRGFWSTFGEHYRLPSDQELAQLAEARARSAERYAAGGLRYHGIESPSKRVLFALDVSGSMEQEVVERERFAAGGYPSFQRFDIVRTELARTIEALESDVEFNLLAFASEVKPWKKKLVRANALTKAAALDWIARLEPLGGKSKEDLARVGLVVSADLESGRTNAFGALRAALGAEGKRGFEDGYQVEIDTLFFLTDGQPSTGEVIEPEEILRRVRELNRARRVVIHALLIGDVDTGFLRRLASENGGRFVDLGR